MSVENVQERVKNIIVEQLGVEADQVKPEAQFVNDLGADSLDTVELIMALEEEFDIVRAVLNHQGKSFTSYP